MPIKHYLEIIKPKIIFGNLVSLVSGFLLASKYTTINYFYFFDVLIGVSLIIASGCVMNNFIDRDIDKIMTRTKNRVAVKNFISSISILIYAIVLFILGFLFLFFFTNKLTILLVLIGFIIYVIVYSLYMKRNSIHSVVIGSLSGGLPPVIGYCAVTNCFDICAFILMIIFILWQIPHSYAINICYIKDYQKAQIPIIPIIKGIKQSKIFIVIYIVIFIFSTLLLKIYNYTGFTYLFITSLTNIYWLIMAIKNFNILNDVDWSYKIFVYSIIVVINLSFAITIDSLIFKINHL